MVDRDHSPFRTEGAGFTDPRSGDAALDQSFDGDGLYSLRAAVAAHAADLGAGEELVEDLVVVANELASNAVRHGGGTGRLRLWRAGDFLHCEVSDRGPGLADAKVGQERAPLNAYGGRGLWVVRQMSAHVDVRTGPEGATVTAAFLVRT